MKVVILAGGFGTRISEESAFRPKPMIEIGGMPILWHIMKTYATQATTMLARTMWTAFRRECWSICSSVNGEKA